MRCGTVGNAYAFPFVRARTGPADGCRLGALDRRSAVRNRNRNRNDSRSGCEEDDTPESAAFGRHVHEAFQLPVLGNRRGNHGRADSAPAHAAAFTSLVGFVCIHQRSLWWGGGGHDGCDRGETMRLDGVSSATASSRRRRRSPARSLCSMTAETSRAARVRFPASMERCSLAEMVLERRSNPTRCRRCLAKMEAVMPRDAGEGRPNAEKTGPIDRESPEPSRIATGMADASSSDREIDGCARLP